MRSPPAPISGLNRLGLAFRPALCLGLAVAVQVHARAEDAALLWSRTVQNLLDVHCVKCHGPLEQKSSLALDTPEAVLKGGDEGPVIVPGQPDQSRLYTYLAAEADPHMPPKKQLSDTDRAAIQRWIAVMPAASAPSSLPTSSPSPAPSSGLDHASRALASVDQAIDTLLAEAWRAGQITPAPEASDATWLRRVYLDLAGRIPTRTEREAFLSAPEPSQARRAALVDRLLASREHAVHLRELWDVLLLGRPKRDSQESRRREHGWWTFLEDAFHSNRPWNEIVHDLLLARPSPAGPKGASWFLFERRNDHQVIAEAVAPLVYGTRIDCAQCHDHPLAREIKQAHYWGLVAAFNRSKNIDGTGEVAEAATGGFVNFTNLRKESQPALLTLLDGRTLPELRPGPDQKEEDRDEDYLDPQAKVRIPRHSRREAFADATTRDNPLLARAFVNRTWALLLGRGLVHPADEMTERNTPSHPELLDWLATDFAAHHHNIRRLLRGIVLSRAYGLVPPRNGPPPDPASFSAAIERPLTAEQLARSWRVALDLAPEDPPLRRAVVSALPEVLPREYHATFQQARFLTDSPELFALTASAPGNTTERLSLIPDPAARTREAFLTVYGRAPDPDELAQAIAFLQSASSNPEAATRDLLWALLTSAEFLIAP